MAHEDLVGSWRLTGFAEASGQAGLIGEDSDPADIDAWLNAGGASLAGNVQPAVGLTLVIGDDALFTERSDGTGPLPWFDAEGVLYEEAVPFDGVLVATDGPGRYLRPTEIASWAQPTEARQAPAILRYDDGDTKIADGLERSGDDLVRTINTVTDELYFNRLVLVYAPA